jgi:hypothetical protein
MDWQVLFGDEFDAEFGELPEAVQDEPLASAKLLAVFGPKLSRPHADTLKDSAFSNMKELRFEADGGVLPSRSIPSARPSCSSPVTNREGARSASASRSSRKPTGASGRISMGSRPRRRERRDGTNTE